MSPRPAPSASRTRRPLLGLGREEHPRQQQDGERLPERITPTTALPVALVAHHASGTSATAPAAAAPRVDGRTSTRETAPSATIPDQHDRGAGGERGVARRRDERGVLEHQHLERKKRSQRKTREEQPDDQGDRSNAPSPSTPR